MKKDKKKLEKIFYFIIFIQFFGLFLMSAYTIFAGKNGVHHGISPFTFGSSTPWGIFIFTGIVCLVFLYGYLQTHNHQKNPDKDFDDFEKKFKKELDKKK